MIFWLQRKWLKMTDIIEDYWSWSNVIKLCAAIAAVWFVHSLMH